MTQNGASPTSSDALRKDHSITSSAMASSPGGTSMPSARRLQVDGEKSSKQLKATERRRQNCQSVCSTVSIRRRLRMRGLLISAAAREIEHRRGRPDAFLGFFSFSTLERLSIPDRRSVLLLRSPISRLSSCDRVSMSLRRSFSPRRSLPDRFSPLRICILLNQTIDDNAN